MSIVERVSETLAARRLHLGLAESCTGGMLAARLTDRPGASRFLHAAVVTYSNDAKERLLGVRPETLAAYGAVSEAVAREMAAGARRVADAEIGVSVTGVAGPDGGTPDKPVGTVWIGFATVDGVRAEVHHFEGDRAAIRRRSVDAALTILDRYLEDGT